MNQVSFTKHDCDHSRLLIRPEPLPGLDIFQVSEALAGGVTRPIIGCPWQIYRSVALLPFSNAYHSLVAE